MLAPRLSQTQVLGEGGRRELNANGARESAQISIWKACVSDSVITDTQAQL